MFLPSSVLAKGIAGTVLSIVFAGIAAAATLNPGDVLVADDEGAAGFGGIFRIDPATGGQTLVFAGTLSAHPTGVAVTCDGRVLAVVDDPRGGPGGVIEIDPATGASIPISSGGLFVNPFGIAIEPTGQILVGDGGDAFGTGSVIRVDSATGAQTLVSSGGILVQPIGIAVAANGDLFVADFSAFGGLGGVIRVNPVTGAQAPVFACGTPAKQVCVHPVGIALAEDGNLFVAHFQGFDTPGQVIRIDPVTGVGAIVWSGGFRSAAGVAVEAGGQLLVTAFHTPTARAEVLRIDPATGGETAVSSGGSLVRPVGIAIARCFLPPADIPTLSPAVVVLLGFFLAASGLLVLRPG